MPDDLAVKLGPSSSSAGNGQEALSAAASIDSGQAHVELGGLVARQIADIKRAGHVDAVSLRNLCQTVVALCRSENAQAARLREKRDALPWSIFQEGVSSILQRLIDIRKGMPSRIMAEIETLYSHRVKRVVRLIGGPLSEAIQKVCEQDVLVLANSPELQPVYEQMRQRHRELEGADHAKP